MIIRQFGIFFGYQDIHTENLAENQTSQPKVSLLTQLKKTLKAILNAKNMTMIQPLTNLIQHWFSQQNDL
ncbi:MAG: hypothetical protein F6K40_15165 [Okeania sp. SIO3I5]|uniref:hypothetical protein n=1 Tax=Okeania sp. SIO3I5 TaxID=2607805 RepID=UPI0013B93408|nr:hypothetical protein [Okeania sp. SIO3I5]NEQ37537.1 hypothetical protein [Okeania sp. SIO3I5]